jgi:hypothetical protein
MPEHYDLTLLDPDNKLGRDIAIMRAEIEELHAKLARMPALVSDLLVLSAGTIGRLLPRLFPPSPQASQLTLPHTIAPRTRDAT